MIQFFSQWIYWRTYHIKSRTLQLVITIVLPILHIPKLTRISLLWKHSVQLRFVNEIKAGRSLKTQITILSLVYKCIPKRSKANKSANNFFNKRRRVYYCWNVSWFEEKIKLDKYDTMRVKIKGKSILFREIFRALKLGNIARDSLAEREFLWRNIFNYQNLCSFRRLLAL